MNPRSQTFPDGTAEQIDAADRAYRPMLSYDNAYAAFEVADNAWQRELVAAFGSAAGDERYQGRGQGLLGSPMRAAYDARSLAAFDFERTLRATRGSERAYAYLDD